MDLSSFPAAVTGYRRITGERVETYSYYRYINGSFHNPEENKYLKILSSNEWFIWGIGKKNELRYFWIDQTYGFLRNIAPIIREIMFLNDLEWIITATTRNPKAHIRKWKMEHLPALDYEFEGRHYYMLKGHITNLK